MKNYLKLMRVKHWIKNILVFVPLFFSGMLNFNLFKETLIGFFAFSFMCSFIYIINDVNDKKEDEKHPKKKNRPIASGIISIPKAFAFAALMLIISFVMNYIAKGVILDKPLYVLITYLIMNILYTLYLKEKVIVDIFIIALGFILRVYYGAFLFNIEVSNWLFLTILSVTLFLGVGKRKKDYINNPKTRKVLVKYTLNFLNSYQNIFTTLTLVFYSLWIIDKNIKNLFLTIPIIIYALMRYDLLLEKQDDGDPTNVIYSDKVLVILALFYGLLIIYFLYGVK